VALFFVGIGCLLLIAQQSIAYPRIVARNKKGQFNQVVDVGKSLASDKRTTAKKKVPKGQGDRGDMKR
jgi:hypothetical protein